MQLCADDTAPPELLNDVRMNTQPFHELQALCSVEARTHLGKIRSYVLGILQNVCVVRVCSFAALTRSGCCDRVAGLNRTVSKCAVMEDTRALAAGDVAVCLVCWTYRVCNVTLTLRLHCL